VVDEVARTDRDAEPLGRPRRPVRVALLDERPDPERREDRDQREQRGADPQQSPPGSPALALLVETTPPDEDRVGEHVVEELVALTPIVAGGRRDGPEDPPALGAG